MDEMRAIELRHAVRHFTDRPMDEDACLQIRQKAEELNRRSGIHAQLITEEPDAFRTVRSKLNGFSNIRNYIAMVGPDERDAAEKIGYCGEQLVLLAQQLGLNTCWAATGFQKNGKTYEIGAGEKLWIVIAVGYGVTQGSAHVSKSFDEVSSTPEAESPKWYAEGVRAALLAPTAMNEQRFRFKLEAGNRVQCKSSGGTLSDLDLGIARLHFEIGAGNTPVTWC